MLKIKVRVLVEKSNGYSTSDLYRDMEIVFSDENVLEIANAAIAAQQSVQLTALRRGLAVSWLIITVLLAVVAFIIGGN